MWLNTLPKGILFPSHGHEELYIYTMLLCADLTQDKQFPSRSNYIWVSRKVVVEFDWYEAKPLLLGNISTPNYSVLWKCFTNGQMFWKESVRQKKITEMEIKLPTDKKNHF
jgi:hypothetical protein